MNFSAIIYYCTFLFCIMSMYVNNNDFNKVYLKYKNIIYYWISTRVSNKSYHDDIFQEVILKIYKHLKDYDISKGSMKNWIYCITMNCINDYYKNFISKSNCCIEDYETIIDENYHFNTKVKELRGILTNFEYDIFVCYYIVGMNKRNISKNLDIPYHICKITIKNMNIKLKDYLEDKEK